MGYSDVAARERKQLLTELYRSRGHERAGEVQEQVVLARDRHVPRRVGRAPHLLGREPLRIEQHDCKPHRWR